MEQQGQAITDEALRAIAEGFEPLPIRDGDKRPHGPSWQKQRWIGQDEQEVREHFGAARDKGAGNIGLQLGTASGGLVDIDFDHPLSLRLRDILTPPTAMETGRSGRARSHKWFIAEPTDDLPATRQYKMPDGSVIIELRSTGAQTVIPPSIHPSGENYRWEAEPWGGEEGPARVNGRVLSIQVALTAMAAVLLDKWPKRGGRHEAYLHLAGWLLRYGEGVHPYWERNLPVLIGALAEATHDEDGPDQRVSETVGTTIKRINEGGKVSGLPSLTEVIGQEHADMVRRLRGEVESLSGFVPEVVHRETEVDIRHVDPQGDHEDDGDDDDLPESAVDEERERDPMEERVSSWASVDLGPYLAGEVVMPEPSVLRRTDGAALVYPGRVNALFGQSESAKSWVALFAGVQEMSVGERVLYIDLEDEPVGSLGRVLALGASPEDIKMLFRYVRPEGPLSPMQRGKFGPQATDDGRLSESVFRALLDKFDPTLIIVDGMTVLYGLHGLDTNDAMSTDVITGWLKSLTRGGRSTVIVIDHTTKGGGSGSAPLGSQHKVAMIQGTSIRVDPIERPMPGHKGLVQLIVFKDRPGAVRAVATQDKEQIAAEVFIDSTTPGETRVRIEPPREGQIVVGSTDSQEAKLEALGVADYYRDRVIELFEGDLEASLSTRHVADVLDVKPAVVYDVWKLLMTEGVVQKVGERRWTRYRLKP